MFLKDAAEKPDDIGRHILLASGMEDAFVSLADKSVCRVLSNEMFLKTAFGPAWADKAAAALEQFHRRMESRSRESMDSEVQKFILDWLLQHFSPSMSGRSNEGLDFQRSTCSGGKGGNDDSALMTEGDSQVFGEGGKDNDGRASGRSQDQQSNPGFGYGSEGQTPFTVKQQDIFLESIPHSLYELAKKIGRAGEDFEKPKGRFSTASKCDINGITTGDNLSALLPSEVALLGDARTQDIFYSRYAGKKLQVFSSASSGTMVTRKHQNGPVIMCVDMSGSMCGEPVDIARKMALAVTIIAQREKRDVLLIKYSDDQKMMKIDCIGRQRRDVERFLSLAALGGNDENSMFSWLFSVVIPSLPSFNTADVLCISDFGWCPLDKKIAGMIEQQKASGMKFYGLNIGSDFGLKNLDEELAVFAAARGYGGDPMSVLDEVWVYAKGECRVRVPSEACR